VFNYRGSWGLRKKFVFEKIFGRVEVIGRVIEAYNLCGFA
jgi:hypothetical protein